MHASLYGMVCVARASSCGRSLADNDLPLSGSVGVPPSEQRRPRRSLNPQAGRPRYELRAAFLFFRRHEKTLMTHYTCNQVFLGGCTDGLLPTGPQRQGMVGLSCWWTRRE